MKFRMLLLIFAMSTIAVRGQVFTNLDFESAGDGSPWNIAAPGWSHSEGDDTQGVYYNSGHVGISQVFSLVDGQSSLAGKFSLRFSSGWSDNDSTASPFVQAFISQTGLIPSGAETIRLLAAGPAPFKVLVANMEVPMRSLGNTRWIGNVGAHAGQVAELKIINTTNQPHRAVTVDNIEFGTSLLSRSNVIYKLIITRTQTGGGNVAKTRFTGWTIFNPTNITLVEADAVRRRFKVEQVKSQIDVVGGQVGKSYTIFKITSGELTGLTAKGLNRHTDIADDVETPSLFKVSGSSVYPMNGLTYLNEHTGIFICDKKNTEYLKNENLDFDQVIQRLRDTLITKGYVEQ